MCSTGSELIPLEDVEHSIGVSSAWGIGFSKLCPKIPTSRGLLGPILSVFWISHPRINHGLAPIPHPTHLGNRTGDRGSKYRIEKTAVLMPIIGKKVRVKGGGVKGEY